MGYKFIQRINSFIGTSDESKPLSADIGSILHEIDTGKEFLWDSEQWRESIGAGSRIKLFNTSTLAWEAATKGTGVGQAVEVENFPAVIAGATVPVSGDVLTAIKNNLDTINSLCPSGYDSIELGYTGGNVTQVLYKLAGATISTLTLGYTGSNLVSVSRS